MSTKTTASCFSWRRLWTIAKFEKAEKELEKQIISISLKVSKGEIVPRFTFGERVRALTRIVEQIQKLNKLTAIPVSEGASELERSDSQPLAWGTGVDLPRVPRPPGQS